MKRNGLLVALLLGCLSLISGNLMAQYYGIQTESDGFRWERVGQNGKEGAQSASGTTLIPLSRGYTFICYHTTDGGWFCVKKNSNSQGACDKNGREIVAPGRYDKVYYRNEDGYAFYSVELNGKKGACDENGREIIAPGKYDEVLFMTSYSYGYFAIKKNGKEGACDKNGREIIAPKYNSVGYSPGDHDFAYKDASGKWILFGIKPESNNTTYASNTSSSGTSSSSSSKTSGSGGEAGLLYRGDYTEGTAVGQRTGYSIPAAMPTHWDIKIYEDRLEDMGTWKFEGISMDGRRIYGGTAGFGAGAQPVKYFVDRDFNITFTREVCAMDCDLFVSQFSKGNVVYDSGSATQGGYNNNSNNGGNTGNTQTQQKTHKCSLCNGTGRVIENNGTSFGNTKYCSECGKTVPDYHYHTTCPSCKGKGWW